MRYEKVEFHYLKDLSTCKRERKKKYHQTWSSTSSLGIVEELGSTSVDASTLVGSWALTGGLAEGGLTTVKEWLESKESPGPSSRKLRLAWDVALQPFTGKYRNLCCKLL